MAQKKRDGPPEPIVRTEVVPAGGAPPHVRRPGGFKDGQLRLRPRPSHGIVVGRQGQERRAKSTPGTLVPSLKRHAAAPLRDAATSTHVAGRRSSAPTRRTVETLAEVEARVSRNGRGYRGTAWYRGNGRGYRGNGRGYRGNGRHRGTGQVVACSSVALTTTVAPPSPIRIRGRGRCVRRRGNSPPSPTHRVTPFGVTSRMDRRLDGVPRASRRGARARLRLTTVKVARPGATKPQDARWVMTSTLSTWPHELCAPEPQTDDGVARGVVAVERGGVDGDDGAKAVEEVRRRSRRRRWRCARERATATPTLASPTGNVRGVPTSGSGGTER